MNSGQQRESNDISESDEGNYENYRRKSLPEGYTPYRENGQIVEGVYDKYDTEYNETSAEEANLHSCSKSKSCCKIGLFSIHQIYNERSESDLAEHKRHFAGQEMKKNTKRFLIGEKYPI